MVELVLRDRSRYAARGTVTGCQHDAGGPILGRLGYLRSGLLAWLTGLEAACLGAAGACTERDWLGTVAGVQRAMGWVADAGSTAAVLWWNVESVDSISSRTLGSVCSEQRLGSDRCPRRCHSLAMMHRGCWST